MPFSKIVVTAEKVVGIEISSGGYTPKMFDYTQSIILRSNERKSEWDSKA